MPIYTFECDKDNGGCGCNFEVVKQMDEISGYKPSCPDCRKRKPVFRDYSADNVLASDGQPKTLGALAEKNTAKMSADEKAAIREKNTAYLKNTPNIKLGEGMKFARGEVSKAQRKKDPKK